MDDEDFYAEEDCCEGVEFDADGAAYASGPRVYWSSAIVGPDGLWDGGCCGYTEMHPSTKPCKNCPKVETWTAKYAKLEDMMKEVWTSKKLEF